MSKDQHQNRPVNPKPSQAPKPQPQPTKNFPSTPDTGKRTGFGDKKGGGPGTNNTGAKK